MKKIIVLNHKSHLTYEKAKKYPLEINDYIRTDQTVIISPAAVYLPYFKGKYSFKLASQTIESDNITGELTGETLKSLEIKYALIGTNDRKNTLNEENRINKKIKAAIKNNIMPIVTIGETYYEKELNKTAQIINKQIKEYLKDIEVKQDIIISYSPNWSYTGKQIPKEEYISEAVELIKDIIKRKYNVNIMVLYGGKITIENISKIDKIKSLDGYIIEEESTNIKNIKQILNEIE